MHKLLIKTFKMKSFKESLNNYKTNELITELLKRGEAPLYPADEEDEAKIYIFKSFWKNLTPSQLLTALSQQSQKDSSANRKRKELLIGA